MKANKKKKQKEDEEVITFDFKVNKQKRGVTSPETQDADVDVKPKTKRVRRTFVNQNMNEESDHYSCSVGPTDNIEESESTIYDSLPSQPSTFPNDGISLNDTVETKSLNPDGPKFNFAPGQPMTPQKKRNRFSTFTPSPNSKGKVATPRSSSKLFAKKDSMDIVEDVVGTPTRSKDVDVEEITRKLFSGQNEDETKPLNATKNGHSILSQSTSLERSNTTILSNGNSLSSSSVSTSLKDFESSTLPLDWSLKTELKCFSTESFEWCSMISSTNESVGVLDFTRNSDSSSFTDDKDAISPDLVHFKKALCYYVHPACDVPPSFLELCKSHSSLTASKSTIQQQNAEFLASRQKSWNEAFRSLYYLYRSGMAPYFYLQHETMYTVLFVSPGIGGWDRYTAILNKSTKGLRESIRNADTPFRIPLQPELETETHQNLEDKETLTELKELQAKNVNAFLKKAKSTANTFEAEPRSALVFQGQVAIHKLFDFLLNHTYHDDVPKLYSQVPFLEASLKQIQIKSNGKRMRTNVDIADNTNDGLADHVYCLELVGPVLPSCLPNLCEVFQSTQHGNFSISIRTSKDTLNFNYHPSTEPKTTTTTEISASPVPKDRLRSSDKGTSPFLKVPSVLGRGVLRRIARDNKNGPFALQAFVE